MFRLLMLTVTGWLGFASLVQANECDALLSSLLAKLPRLEFGGRSRMAGAPNFDIVYLRHSQASQVVLSCRPRQPSLSIDWRGGPPPAGYFQLIGQLGSIMTGVPPDAVRTGAVECQKLALAAAYEMSEFESMGVRFECAIFTGRGTTITIFQPER
jgi:hypothetical protein